jgi:hypothetical protein
VQSSPAFTTPKSIALCRAPVISMASRFCGYSVYVLRIVQYLEPHSAPSTAIDCPICFRSATSGALRISLSWQRKRSISDVQEVERLNHTNDDKLTSAKSPDQSHLHGLPWRCSSQWPPTTANAHTTPSPLITCCDRQVPVHLLGPNIMLVLVRT